MNTEADDTTSTVPPGERLPIPVRELLDQTTRLARVLYLTAHGRCLEDPRDKDADALMLLILDVHARLDLLNAWASGGQPSFIVDHHIESFNEVVAAVAARRKAAA